MQYNYDMGIKVNNTPIPDPSVFKYEVADLDTEAERDARGYLHRKCVATKINFSLEWKGLEWDMLTTILNAINFPKFTLTAPDPRTFNTQWTGDYYVGNREGQMHYYLPERSKTSALTLSMKFIQY